jgi:hypothetical protein
MLWIQHTEVAATFRYPTFLRHPKVSAGLTATLSSLTTADYMLFLTN